MSINLKKFEGAVRFGLLGALLGGATLVSAVKADAAVVINEVYGGGGNSGATLKNDFIELYNNGNEPVDITGYTLQYAAAASPGLFSVAANTNATVLSGIIYPKEYFLVQEAAGAGTQVNNLVPDQIGNLALAGTAGKVALANNNVAVTFTVGPNSTFSANKVDMVGYGAANAYEGTAPAPLTSNPTSVSRAVIGVDTNDNKNDFVLSTTPSPMNSSALATAAAPPAVVSITPNAPADTVGASRTFTLTVRDGNGVADLNTVWFVANTTLDWSTGASIGYDKVNNQMYLRDNDHFSGPITPGSGTLSNDAVTIDGTTVSVTPQADGKSLQLVFTLQTKAGMVGNNILWGRADDVASTTDPRALPGEFGDVRKGTWTVSGATGTQGPPTAAIAPLTAGTTTNATVGTPLTVTMDLTDPNGATDLQSGFILINDPDKLSWAAGLTLVYDVRNNRIYLRSSDGTSFLGGQMLGESTGTLENEAGILDLATSTVTAITNGVHLSLVITPKVGLVGTKQVWTHVQDNAGTSDATANAAFGFKNEGLLVTSNPSNAAPSALVLVAGQAAGKGTTNAVTTDTATTFQLDMTDPNGASDLKDGWFLVNTTLDWANGITLVYDAPRNILFLRTTDGQNFVGGTPGATGTLDNDAVSVNLATTTVTRTATGISLVMPATVKAAFAGTKRIWSRVEDNSGTLQAGADAGLGFNSEGTLIITTPVPPASTKPSGGSS